MYIETPAVGTLYMTFTPALALTSLTLNHYSLIHAYSNSLSLSLSLTNTLNKRSVGDIGTVIVEW